MVQSERRSTRLASRSRSQKRRTSPGAKDDKKDRSPRRSTKEEPARKKARNGRDENRADDRRDRNRDEKRDDEKKDRKEGRGEKREKGEGKRPARGEKRERGRDKREPREREQRRRSHSGKGGGRRGSKQHADQKPDRRHGDRDRRDDSRQKGQRRNSRTRDADEGRSRRGGRDDRRRSTSHRRSRSGGRRSPSGRRDDRGRRSRSGGSRGKRDAHAKPKKGAKQKEDSVKKGGPMAVSHKEGSSSSSSSRSRSGSRSCEELSDSSSVSSVKGDDDVEKRRQAIAEKRQKKRAEERAEKKISDLDAWAAAQNGTNGDPPMSPGEIAEPSPKEEYDVVQYTIDEAMDLQDDLKGEFGQQKFQEELMAIQSKFPERKTKGHSDMKAYFDQFEVLTLGVFGSVLPRHNLEASWDGVRDMMARMQEAMKHPKIQKTQEETNLLMGLPRNARFQLPKKEEELFVFHPLGDAPVPGFSVPTTFDEDGDEGHEFFVEDPETGELKQSGSSVAGPSVAAVVEDGCWYVVTHKPAVVLRAKPDSKAEMVGRKKTGKRVRVKAVVEDKWLQLHSEELQILGVKEAWAPLDGAEMNLPGTRLLEKEA